MTYIIIFPTIYLIIGWAFEFLLYIFKGDFRKVYSEHPAITTVLFLGFWPILFLITLLTVPFKIYDKKKEK